MRLLVAVFTLWFPATLLAFGGDAGGDGGSAGWSWGGPGYHADADGSGDAGPGCCISFPPELDDQVRILERSFLETDFDELRRQNHARTLCYNHPCAGLIAEIEAKDILRDLISEVRRKEELAQTRRSNSIAAFAAIISAVAALLSILGLWQTHQANKLAREASERSIRNETRIEQIREM